MSFLIPFHGDDVPAASFHEALFHIIPVPLEKTVSYGAGTAEGPRAILEASCQLELFDNTSVPAQYGIHTEEAMDCSGDICSILTALEERVATSSAAKAIPIILGGEHSLSHGCIRGIKKQFGTDFGVIHFDAHADLRFSYEGSQQSHASVMRRIAEEEIALLQIGTRSYSLEEDSYRKEHHIPYFDAETIWQQGTASVKMPETFPEKVFISFDVDCFDASVIPATGTPVPGGLMWHQIAELLERLLQERICVGFDMVELAPVAFLHGVNFTVAQLVYNLMGYISRNSKNRAYYNLTA